MNIYNKTTIHRNGFNTTATQKKEISDVKYKLASNNMTFQY